MFISKVDEENANFFSALDQAKDIFGNKIVLLMMPVMDEGKLMGMWIWLR